MLSPPSGTARPCHPEKQTATVEPPRIVAPRTNERIMLDTRERRRCAANFGQNGATVKIGAMPVWRRNH